MDMFDPQYYFSVKFTDCYHFTIFEEPDICKFVEADNYDDTNVLLVVQDFGGFQQTIGNI